jgi:hypothetical protein
MSQTRFETWHRDLHEVLGLAAPPVAIAFLDHLPSGVGRIAGPDSAKFPVNFPVSREFGAETGSQLTASSATQSGLCARMTQPWRRRPGRKAIEHLPVVG